jgi:hypothetical protein
MANSVVWRPDRPRRDLLTDPEQTAVPNVATAICQVNLSNGEYHVEVHDWPDDLLGSDGDLLDLDGLLFRSGSREVILRRPDGFARFILADDSAELRAQDAPGWQPIRTLRYTLEGWFQN